MDRLPKGLFLIRNKSADLSKSEWTTKLLTLAETKSFPTPKPSSRKIAIVMPWLLHNFCNGFKIDEKYMGLKKARKGAHRIEIA